MTSYMKGQPPAFEIRCECGYQGLCMWQDEGIGGYEYWGDKGTDIRWVAICPHCEEEVEE